MFEPLKRLSLSEIVASQIQRKIIMEEIAIGSRLPPVKELSKEFGVSELVIREALKLLETMGHIRRRKGPRGGAYVINVFHRPLSIFLKKMTENGKITVEDIWDVRFKLEPHAIERAIRNPQEEAFKKFRQLFDQAKNKFDDPVFLKNKNIEFHLILADLSGNPILSFFIKALLEILAEVAFNFLDLEFEQNLLKIHERLFLAIYEKDMERALRLFNEDLTFLKQTLKKHDIR